MGASKTAQTKGIKTSKDLEFQGIGGGFLSTGFKTNSTAYSTSGSKAVTTLHIHR